MLYSKKGVCENNGSVVQAIGENLLGFFNLANFHKVPNDSSTTIYSQQDYNNLVTILDGFQELAQQAFRDKTERFCLDTAITIALPPASKLKSLIMLTKQTPPPITVDGDVWTIPGDAVAIILALQIRNCTYLAMVNVDNEKHAILSEACNKNIPCDIWMDCKLNPLDC